MLRCQLSEAVNDKSSAHLTPGVLTLSMWVAISSFMSLGRMCRMCHPVSPHLSAPLSTAGLSLTPGSSPAWARHVSCATVFRVLFYFDYFDWEFWERNIAAKKTCMPQNRHSGTFFSSSRQEVPLFACTCISFFLLGKNTQKSCVEQTSHAKYYAVLLLWY